MYPLPVDDIYRVRIIDDQTLWCKGKLLAVADDGAWFVGPRQYLESAVVRTARRLGLRDTKIEDYRNSREEAPPSESDGLPELAP